MQGECSRGCRAQTMVLRRDDWLSPRVTQQRVEDAAWARAEQALRGIERQKKQERQFELEKLELVASFMHLEATERQQRDELSAAVHKKHDSDARRRVRNGEARYHERCRATNAAIPQELDKSVMAATIASARKIQREALDGQVAAQRAAQRQVAEQQAIEAAAMVAADSRAQQADLQSRDDRPLEQKLGVPVEWERQQELSNRRRGENKQDVSKIAKQIGQNRPFGSKFSSLAALAARISINSAPATGRRSKILTIRCQTGR